MADAATTAGQRLDKWLWSARFYKTRNLAIEAINGGHVQLNGNRVKPARAVRPGDRLVITRGETRMEVEVRALASRRGPAPEARALYEETADSQLERQNRAEQRALLAASRSPAGRPDKKQRRELRRLRHSDDE